ncbi:hypothetical protein [Burkholderia singularis]|uniref:hypothetical protein n=1 Tax=Burkholderia singularis TaxID=1503053 RepID=UPI00117D6D48|nr:hypothetical protein [Burkholderia singularis]
MKITDDMLTEWFPASINPVHEGEYETRALTASGLRRKFIDGQWWYFSRRNGRWYLSEFKKFPGAEWRGLKEPYRD